MPVKKDFTNFTKYDSHIHSMCAVRDNTTYFELG